MTYPHQNGLEGVPQEVTGPLVASAKPDGTVMRKSFDLSKDVPGPPLGTGFAEAVAAKPKPEDFFTPYVLVDRTDGGVVGLSACRGCGCAVMIDPHGEIEDVLALHLSVCRA